MDANRTVLFVHSRNGFQIEVFLAVYVLGQFTGLHGLCAVGGVEERGRGVEVKLSCGFGIYGVVVDVLLVVGKVLLNLHIHQCTVPVCDFRNFHFVVFAVVVAENQASSFVQIEEITLVSGLQELAVHVRSGHTVVHGNHDSVPFAGSDAGA